MGVGERGRRGEWGEVAFYFISHPFVGYLISTIEKSLGSELTEQKGIDMMSRCSESMRGFVDLGGSPSLTHTV